MFIEATRQTVLLKFGAAELWLRYDNKAFLNIENNGFEPFNILSQADNPEAVRCFLTAGLDDWVQSVSWSERSAAGIVNRLMSAEGYADTLTATIQAAVILALPSAAKGNKRNNEGNTDIRMLMTVFCDVMGRSEADFWSSTLREVNERWERYAEAEGRKKPAEEIREFDDD